MPYQAPGVYVEEKDTGARPIELVGTSTAAFLGVPPKEDAFLHEHRALNNWTEFERAFVAQNHRPGGNILANAVHGFFQNGGSYCYVVNVGKDGALAGTGSGRTGIQVLEEVDDVAIVAAPGYSDAASYDTLLQHCEVTMKDRVAILDPAPGITDMQLLTKDATVPAGEAPPKKPGQRPPEFAACIPGGCMPPPATNSPCP